MKITVVYGQNHKGSTYRIARMLAEKLPETFRKFFCRGILENFVWAAPSAFCTMQKIGSACGKPAAHHTKIG